MQNIQNKKKRTLFPAIFVLGFEKIRTFPQVFISSFFPEFILLEIQGASRPSF